MPSKNSVFQTAHYGVADNQIIVNVTEWARQNNTDPDPNNAEMQGFSDLVGAAWVGFPLTLLHQNYVYSKTITKEVIGWNPNPLTGKKRLTFAGGWESNGSSGTTGSIAGDPLPNTVAGVIRKITALTGKRWRGKVKLSPLGESQSLFNKLTTTAVTALNTAFNHYFAPVNVPAIGTGPFIPVVFSVTTLYAGPQTGPAKISSSQITTAITTPTLGVQKSRKLRQPG